MYDGVIYYAVNYSNYDKANLEHSMVITLVVASKHDDVVVFMVYSMYDYPNYYYLAGDAVYVVFVFHDVVMNYFRVIAFFEDSDHILDADFNSIIIISGVGGIITSVGYLIFVLFKEVVLNSQND